MLTTTAHHLSRRYLTFPSATSSSFSCLKAAAANVVTEKTAANVVHATTRRLFQTSAIVWDEEDTSFSPTAATLATAPHAQSRLIVLDTTLRDGEQSPGATLNFKEKVDIARALSLLGVDVCEAGFPIASPGDFEAVKGIAQTIGPLELNRSHGPMTICGLARATHGDIQRCFDAVKYAPRHRIHTFLATSDIHLKYKLNISRQDCIAKAVDAVAFAKSLCDDVQFSPEDAGRSDPDFLLEVCEAVIAAGATTLNIPDTVGYTVPEEYGAILSHLVSNVSQKEVIFSTHCHNDLGLASANTLAGITAGARQVEVTINGIGERAGNSSLEEIIMTLKTRPLLYPVHTLIDTTQLIRCSRMVSHYTGMAVQPNKAIVGANAFAHESGIHQDGVLKHQATYEIMLPESVGLCENKLVLGKHSGKHAYKKRMTALGLGGETMSADLLEYYVEKFKCLADEKKHVTDADIEAIVTDHMFTPDAFWTLQGLHVTAGNRVKPTATVTLSYKDGQEVSEAAMGSGPVDAVYQAIKKATESHAALQEFSIKSITGESEALGEVTVRLMTSSASSQKAKDDDTFVTAADDYLNPQTGLHHQRQFVGTGANTDILVASATAYLNALNRMLAAQDRAATMTSSSSSLPHVE